MTVSPAGVLSGTPTMTGTYVFIVTASDKINATGSQAYFLSVTNATTTSLTGPASVVAGQPATFTVNVNNNPSGSGSPPTGLVTLLDGSNSVASVSLPTTTTSSGFSLTPTTITVASTAGFTSTGQFSILTTTGQYAVITYTGLTTTTFTGCTGPNSGSVASGAAIVQDTIGFLTSTLNLGSHTLTAAYGPDSNHTGSTSTGFGVSVVSPSFSDTFNNGTFNGTTITGSSNNVALPTSIINVTSTTGFAPSGQLAMQTSAGYVLLNYTGLTTTTFTGVSGGAGLGAVLHTGYTVQPTFTRQLDRGAQPHFG